MGRPMGRPMVRGMVEGMVIRWDLAADARECAIPPVRPLLQMGGLLGPRVTVVGTASMFSHHRGGGLRRGNQNPPWNPNPDGWGVKG